MGVWKWGRKTCWKSDSKGSPHEHQQLLNIDRRRVLERSQKGTSKRHPLQDQEKWDLAIIYYTLARSDVSEKVAFWIAFWSRFWRQNHENRVPEQHQKSAENRHPFYEMLGPFGGQSLSKKSVVCRSKTSLTCGPLKIVILEPSGHPKSTKFEVLFDATLIDFEDDGGKQCIEIQCSFLWVVDVISAVLL